MKKNKKKEPKPFRVKSPSQEGSEFMERKSGSKDNDESTKPDYDKLKGLK